MLKHHVFVLLSDYEGMPVALMEAMACGLVPVCLWEPSGVAELVQHDINGLVVHDRGDGFVAAISRLANEAGLWERLSRRAQETIREKYSVDVEFRRWHDLVLGMKGSDGRTRRIGIPILFRLPDPPLPWGDRRRPAMKVSFVNFVRRAQVAIRLAIRPRTRLRALFRGRR
jgi:hypothetical protein